VALRRRGRRRRRSRGATCGAANWPVPCRYKQRRTVWPSAAEGGRRVASSCLAAPGASLDRCATGCGRRHRPSTLRLLRCPGMSGSQAALRVLVFFPTPRVVTFLVMFAGRWSYMKTQNEVGGRAIPGPWLQRRSRGLSGSRMPDAAVARRARAQTRTVGTRWPTLGGVVRWLCRLFGHTVGHTAVSGGAVGSACSLSPAFCGFAGTARIALTSHMNTWLRTPSRAWLARPIADPAVNERAPQMAKSPVAPRAKHGARG
jgi:hypothetical protein